MRSLLLHTSYMVPYTVSLDKRRAAVKIDGAAVASAASVFSLYSLSLVYRLKVCGSSLLSLKSEELIHLVRATRSALAGCGRSASSRKRWITS